MNINVRCRRNKELITGTCSWTILKKYWLNYWFLIDLPTMLFQFSSAQIKKKKKRWTSCWEDYRSQTLSHRLGFRMFITVSDFSYTIPVKKQPVLPASKVEISMIETFIGLPSQNFFFSSYFVHVSACECNFFSHLKCIICF